MKVILLLALSAIMLSQSYGFVYADHMASHMYQNPFSMTIVTDSLSYEAGEMINISGSVSDYDESDTTMQSAITLTFLNPKNSYIGVEQSLLNPDGSYSITVNAVGSQWKFEGDYTITACNGKDRCASTTFIFVLSEPEEVIEVIEEIEISEEELAEGCGEGTHLEDGVCMLDETTAESTPVSTGSVPATGMNAWIYSITFTVLIAFAIMIILYVISRASRRKIVN